jgi:hypothetical protein
LLVKMFDFIPEAAGPVSVTRKALLSVRSRRAVDPALSGDSEVLQFRPVLAGAGIG